MKTETIPLVRGGPGGAGAAPEAAGLVLLAAEPEGTAPPAARLPPEGLFVGREPPQSGLAIAQTAVSRVHARGFARDGRLFVRDVDSRNGTIVRGRRVTEAEVRHGDVVRFGNALYQVVERDVGDHLASTRAFAFGEGFVVGPQLARLLRELEPIARTDLPVLVLGETGTGKERVARATHEQSGRRGRLCAINCAAIPTTLFESELFGYRRGAFTGADRDKIGLVRAAHEGTLMLDEIGDMPLEAQAKLLRLLETREVVPLGATSGERVDVRLVCATHRDPAALVAEGRFRGDLLARIHGHVVRLPPLRTRREDVGLLVRHFLGRAERPDLGVTFDAWVAMHQYDWPFNVRELETAIRRALAVARGRAIEPADLPDAVREAMAGYGEPPAAAAAGAAAAGAAAAGAAAAGSAAASAAPTALGAAFAGPPRPPTEEELRAELARAEGNVAEVARRFDKDRTQVHRWLRRFGIDPEAFRRG